MTICKIISWGEPPKDTPKVFFEKIRVNGKKRLIKQIINQK